MSRMLEVYLDTYNVDYKYEITQEKLEEELIELFSDDYGLSCDNAKRLVEDYIGYDQIEKDYLEKFVNDLRSDLEIEFEKKLANEIIEIIKRNKSITFRKIVDLLPYETLILEYDEYVWDIVLSSLKEQKINYTIDDENQRITLEVA